MLKKPPCFQHFQRYTVCSIVMTGKFGWRVALVTSETVSVCGLAKGLAEAGARFAVNYKNDKAGAESTCAEIRAKGGKPVQCKPTLG